MQSSDYSYFAQVIPWVYFKFKQWGCTSDPHLSCRVLWCIPHYFSVYSLEWGVLGYHSVLGRTAVSRPVITTAYQITAQWQHHPSHWIIQPSAIWHRKQGMVIQCYRINVTCFENKRFSFVIFNRPRQVWMFLSVLSDILLGDAFSVLLGTLLKCTLR